ncbi:flagellar motor switch protein FliG [Caldithrix abyssi DSM 13497]|uniref:Flagellar motor switch protein FliG n=1 Tax=Caldithrix abyssi DSM 13497 TaxID=880073 RepID=H1XPZ3_CALAY|nr:flagellar motor switch protein FliG [Caldithrix abyssi]APF18219.1 flagellar motor switch protein FliG [Caldithrix abyssi DSM 13497]EHO42244.1 flagellar motor switch protein FliG [Caldithrix abyssi DSM 13497]
MAEVSVSRRRLTSIQKVALLMIALGVEKASMILKNLNESEVEKISIEMAKLQNVPAEVISEVIVEFYEMMTANKFIVQGGIDYARELLEAAWGKKRAEDVLKRVEAETEVSAFYLLQTVDDKQLINFLQNEHPQTAALILSNLRPRQAAAIISEMPEEMQYEIAYRIATMEKTSPELVEDIENVLREQLGNLFGGNLSKTGGVETVAEILNSVNRTAEKNILTHLRERDSQLAEEVTNLMFLFEDIVHLPNATIQRILKEVDSKTLALALKATSSELKERIFKNMSERAAKMLKEELDYLGPVRIKDVEQAQKEILETARRLEEQGEIMLVRGEEEELIE